MKLGSLFDGSGGFPLAGALCGIEPIWASEVEPYPIAVTKTRFPTLKHLGDIRKINGAEIEPVDIVSFGSPCQDLSTAGKRAGLKHEDNGDDETTRSGLFMEAVRIIKEMREKTNGEYPRFAVWENVPGAFSSNKGEDFRIVLEELVKIVEPTAVMPEVPRFGWAYADSYCGDGWSLAYRVFDAQYWGVPQRRRRIYLVADFGGQFAREVLFEREGLRGYFTEGRTPWKATPTDAERSIGADDREGEIPYTLKIRSGVSVDSYGKAAGKGALIQKNLSATLGVGQDKYLFQPVGADPYNGDLTGDKSATLGVNCGLSTGRNAVAYGISAYESNSMKSSNPHSGIYEAQTSRTIDLNGGNPACNQGGIAIVEPFCKSARARSADDATTWKRGKVANTLNTFDQSESRTNELVVETVALEGNGQRPSHRGDGYAVTDKSYTLNTTEVHGVVYAVDQGGGKSQANVTENLSPTLTCTHGGEPAVAIDNEFFNQWKNSLRELQNADDSTVPALVAKRQDEAAVRYIVRRLTPTECARLQGFADRWGDIDKKTKFSDEEYRFWHDVRNTHAAINGKAVKEYTKAQILTWYNKLHTDSAEYKLWGNGIALPTALYVMQGIKEASNVFK